MERQGNGYCHRCGLEAVSSVRRIFSYQMTLSGELGADQRRLIHQQCFDPLTQTVIHSPEHWGRYF